MTAPGETPVADPSCSPTGGAGERQAGGPSTWLVLGDKLGDNAQAEIIAASLGWPCERRSLRFRPEFVLGKPPFKPSLYHLDPARSDALEPPWPELILTIGRRPSMAALWVRDQSGGRTKVVLIGRPKRNIDDFALIIATPQYRLPARGNVVHLDLPLMRADPGPHRRGGRSLARAARGPAAAADGGAHRRPDQAVRLRRRGHPLADRAHPALDRRRRHALRHHQPKDPGRGGGRAEGTPPRLGQAVRLDAGGQRQPLPGAARPRRPVRGHRRQHLDDGGGGEARSAARDLPAAGGQEQHRGAEAGAGAQAPRAKPAAASPPGSARASTT